MTNSPFHRNVLIVGGGFGGYYAAHALTHHKVPVTLIDTDGYQTFQPMLYQAATGLIDASSLEFHFSRMSEVESVADTVTDIDLETRTVTLSGGTQFTADYLVLATGATVNFYGVEGAAEHALPLYTLPDAHAIKRRLQQMVHTDAGFRIVVIGAGATGVEVTGALSDVIDDVLPRTYPSFTGGADLHLVDHGSAPLASMSTDSQEFATKTLTEVGVTLHMGRAVTAVSETGVTLDDGSSIDADMVVWAGGLTISGPALSPPPATGHGGRIVIDSDLRIPGHPQVYCIGDAAADAVEPLPQLGSVAKQQGRHVGDSIHRQIADRDPKPFHYRDMGDMAMIRHDAAVVEMGPHHHPVSGRAAFAMWLGLHAYLLPGERNRVDALHDWVHELATGKSKFLAD